MCLEIASLFLSVHDNTSVHLNYALLVDSHCRLFLTLLHIPNTTNLLFYISENRDNIDIFLNPEIV